MSRFTRVDAMSIAELSKQHDPNETLMVSTTVWSGLRRFRVLDDLHLFLVVNPRMLKGRWKFTDRSPGKLFARRHLPRGEYS